MHVQTKKASVPGCALAVVEIPKKCGADSYIREFDDRTEVHCQLTLIVKGKIRNAEQTLTYRCNTNPKSEEKK